MSGVYRCKCRLRIPRPQSPAPPKEVIETEPVKETPIVITEEAQAPVKEEDKAAPIIENIDTKPVIKKAEPAPVIVSVKRDTEQPPIKQEIAPQIIERSIKPEPPKHNMFHAFKSEPGQQTAKRTIRINPLLRKRI